MQTITLFFSAIITILFMDAVWIGYLAKDLYQNNLGMLVRKTNEVMTPIWSSAIVVYFLIAFGILYFVLPKANGQYNKVLISGMLFGAVTYGIYDFTNYAILKDWPLKVTLIDFVWGTVLCGVTSVVVLTIQHRFYQ